MKLEVNHPLLGLNIDIPQQNGMSFKVNLYLEGDELHLCAGDLLWLEWFPCNESEIVQKFFDAVRGVLTGKYRILEYYRFGRGVKALLQRPGSVGWETIGTSSSGMFPISWGIRTKVLQNVMDSEN